MCSTSTAAYPEKKYQPPEKWVKDVYDLAEYLQGAHKDDPNIQELCKRVLFLQGIREMLNYLDDIEKADTLIERFETLHRSIS